MNFNSTAIVDQLAANGDVFKSLFSSIPFGMTVWKPAPEHWCILEIACHLLDEERLDFSARIKSTLADPAQALTPIDPPSWVTERKYMEQDLASTVEEFLVARSSSVEWLRSLHDAPWHNTHQHDRLGELSSQLFLENWLAHDYLHIRQINRRKYEYHREHAGTSLDYAGDW